MEKIKTFLTTLLSIVLFISMSYLTINIFSNTLVNYDVIFNTLNKNEIKYEQLIKLELPEGIMEYIDIDEIVYDYFTNETLYQVGKLDKRPTINKDILNQKIKSGVDEYIDYRIEQELGVLKELSDQLKITNRIKNEVYSSIEKQYNIDYEKDDIISNEKLEEVYTKVEEKYNEEKAIIDIVKLLINEDYRMISIIVLVVCFLLIGIINFNIMASFGYSVIPLIVEIILLLIMFFVTLLINFKGTVVAEIINDFLKVINVEVLKFIVVYVLILFVFVILYYIFKNINIVKSHKKGVANLDTLFDDYDDDKVATLIKDEDKDEKSK